MKDILKSTQEGAIPKALLVSIKTPDVSDLEAEESLAELERLCSTLGFQIIAKEYQRRSATTGSTVVGEGKLKQLAEYTGGPGVLEKPSFGKKSKAAEAFATEDQSEIFEAQEVEEDLNSELQSKEKATVVVFDCELSPSQLKNVEGALGVEVLDRTGVIIEIFSRHAKTRAARLQVEIARLNYLAPRLREVGGPSERHAGRGSGDTQMEMDRRRIRDRVTELKQELVNVQKEDDHRRAKRAEQLTVALVGYTNAGKSSTMRALTGSEVLVQDKLFATLDTTVRAMHPETHPRILVTDTVGFIKKLPHDLVASFRSTLQEAVNASLLLFVVDASDPTFKNQLEVTREVLDEVGVDDVPSMLVLNKADRLSDREKLLLKRQHPGALLISAKVAEDVALLREEILKFFEEGMIEEEIMVPYDAKGLVGEIRSHMRVVKETFENDGVRMVVRSSDAEFERLKKKFPIIG
jgi:GTPase